MRLPLQYDDLLRYSASVPLIDRLGQDTLWETVYFSNGKLPLIIFWKTRVSSGSYSERLSHCDRIASAELKLGLSLMQSE